MWQTLQDIIYRRKINILHNPHKTTKQYNQQGTHSWITYIFMSYPHTDAYLVVLFDKTLSTERRYSYNLLLAIQREQFVVCQENFQICGMLNNKISALQNFSVSEMYDNTTYVHGRCRLLCKASMAVVLSDMTKDTSCIIRRPFGK